MIQYLFYITVLLYSELDISYDKDITIMYIQQQQQKSSKYCEKINVDETHAYDFQQKEKLSRSVIKNTVRNNEQISKIIRFDRILFIKL